MRFSLYGLACVLMGAAVLAQDNNCGNASAPLDNTRPNVLIIGDSISMAIPYTPGGYGIPVQQILASHGVACTHAGGWYAGGQCSNTVKGLLCTNSTSANNWLNVTGTYDVIHFNFGLHDLVDCNDNPECSEGVSLQQYGLNLQTIYARLAPRAKHIIWTTTTPVPNITTSLGRTYARAVEYNTQALTSLKAVAGSKLIVDDLWSDVISQCGVGYTNCSLQIPANVHYEPAGQLFLGQHAAAIILSVLGL
jgi:hypothetical protein